jgi:hypothetical protein
MEAWTFMGVGCVAAINALAGGSFDGWAGLPPRCTRAQVEEVLSVVEGDAASSGQGSGPRRYAPTPAAPHGLTVHYESGTVDHISVVEPRLERPVDAMLGEPEGRWPSGLEGSDEQWVYARLGLAFHMKSESSGVSRLFVFGPTTIEGYRTSALGRARTLRHQAPRRSVEEGK